MTIPDERLTTLSHDIASLSLTRRDVLKRAMALGLTAPVIAGLLAACGGDDDTPETDDTTETTADQSAQDPTAAAEPTDEGKEEPTEPAAAEETPATAESPTAEGEPEEVETPAPADEGARGGHGLVRLLWWQAATTLNPHLTTGFKDWDPARLCMEPLAEFDAEDNLIPVLAAEVPTLENGGLSEDGRTVTWKLREGVTWHDGEPFTAADVVFTYEWVSNPENSTSTSGRYQGIESVEAPDDFTVVITFENTKPAWFEPFVGSYGGSIIPEHILKDFTGDQVNTAPFNLKPIGTGPYTIVDFQPGNVVLGELNPNYWDPGKPYFDSVELIGVADALTAARAVLQTGEGDYATRIQAEPALLEELGAMGNGEIVTVPPTQCERIVLQMADPYTEVDGERSKLGVPHPFLTDLKVRQALSLAVDSETIATQLYGPSGSVTSNFLVAPARFVSPNTSHEFDLERAAQLLDEAGWELVDGQRQKDGVSMSVLYQTDVNAVRQRTQEVVKEGLESIGVPVEIQAIQSSVFFSSDPGVPESFAKFYADFAMAASSAGSPYPISQMRFGLSRDPENDISQKVNDWTGTNIGRWVNEEFNEAYTAAESELDPDVQVELFVTMNDIYVNDVAIIPLVARSQVEVISAEIEVPERSSWASPLWDLKDWQRKST